MNFRVMIPLLVAIVVLSSVAIFYIMDIEQQLEAEKNKHIPERLVFLNGSVSEFFQGTQDIKKLEPEEFQKFVMALASLDNHHDEWSAKYQSVRATSDFRANTGSVSLDRTVFPVPMAEPEPQPESAGFQSDESSGLNYSETNVQVKGVDEPDYVKTDGKYVYVVSGERLIITEAYPAVDAKIVFKAQFDVDSQNIQNMFLNNDRLVVFYYGNDRVEIIPEFEYEPRSRYIDSTYVQIIDITNREDPQMVENLEVDGHFHNARMIGDIVYLVTISGVQYHYPVLPEIRNDDGFISAPEIFYFDNLDRNYNFNTVTAIDIFSQDVNSETFLMGGTGTIYVSENSLYVAYQEEMPRGYFDSVKRDRFFDVVVPLFPENTQQQIREIQNDSSLDSNQKWIEVSELLQETYNTLDGDSRDRLFSEINKKLDEYDKTIRELSVKTAIHRIELDGIDLKYSAKGSVPGTLLNQFSMDEHNGKFRVATTNEYYSPHDGNIRYNAVYVLDENLDVVGSLDRIAQNESIFSARFIEERLYLVTFERIDPFFVIDLSQDTPRILGELKIPGFSNYLHPYDEDHVIGIGRDTTEKDNRVMQLGVKIALFDVSDVRNPSVLDEVIIGDRRADSMSLDDHRAFFFDKERNVLSIPIHGRTATLFEDSFAPERERWHGFYVFSLDTKDGFDLKGTIQHSTGDDKWPYHHNGPRSFYVEDVLYTVSDSYLKMNGISDMSEINSIRLDERTGGFVDILR